MANVTDWLSELDDHGFEDTVTGRKLAVLNDTIADICSREPWPFLEKTLQLDYDGSSAEATNWPSDFSKALVLTDPTNGIVLNWERLDTVRKRHPANLTDVAAPYLFYMIGSKVYPYPTPPNGTVLDLAYLAFHPQVTDSTVEADILIPARHHCVVPVGALYKLYMMEDDPELAQVFSQEYESRIEKMREDLMRQQYDRPDAIFVNDEDYFDDLYYY